MNHILVCKERIITWVKLSNYIFDHKLGTVVHIGVLDTLKSAGRKLWLLLSPLTIF